MTYSEEVDHGSSVRRRRRGAARRVFGHQRLGLLPKLLAVIAALFGFVIAAPAAHASMMPGGLVLTETPLGSGHYVGTFQDQRVGDEIDPPSESYGGWQFFVRPGSVWTGQWWDPGVRRVVCDMSTTCDFGDLPDGAYSMFVSYEGDGDNWLEGPYPSSVTVASQPAPAPSPSASDLSPNGALLNALDGLAPALMIIGAAGIAVGLIVFALLWAWRLFKRLAGSGGSTK